ncbi:hypothetical protein E2C01_077349 [Portunus trituberculatus]|uniref:Uncharacterized protein n=1 Tax=Portunus trituberculatus TaxID=210409 RepID=A0A5B7IE70_PORTR|nr:hypothetical protein [Portunus trituberculatus]
MTLSPQPTAPPRQYGNLSASLLLTIILLLRLESKSTSLETAFQRLSSPKEKKGVGEGHLKERRSTLGLPHLLHLQECGRHVYITLLSCCSLFTCYLATYPSPLSYCSWSSSHFFTSTSFSPSLFLIFPPSPHGTRRYFPRHPTAWPRTLRLVCCKYPIIK